MRMPISEYILFIDTETSDVPQRWYASTRKVHKWPYILQIAWTIYTRDGQHVLTRDFYINPGKPIDIVEASGRLHGITLEMLEEKGIEREKVISLLAADIDRYAPLLVGHFLEFDKKMMEVGFNRAGLEHNFVSLPKFCTMRNTKYAFDTRENPRFMRLNELYESLFQKEMVNNHNALADAIATKDCFFEMVRTGEITEKTIATQQRYFKHSTRFPWISIVVFSMAAMAIVMYLIYLFAIT